MEWKVVNVAPATYTLAHAAGMSRTAQYDGDTLMFTVAAGVRNFIDSKTQIKLVDASVKNGCDGDLAGHKDVRTTANLIAGTTETCHGGTDATTTIDSVSEADQERQFNLCNSKIGQGRKACQSVGCTYTAMQDASIGFAYTDLLTNPLGFTSSVAAWRLCMVSH